MNSVIYLGGGCFWCTEAVFEQVKGVETVISGYSGGKIKNPSYKESVLEQQDMLKLLKLNMIRL